jgi:hypothetical protein
MSATLHRRPAPQTARPCAARTEQQSRRNVPFSLRLCGCRRVTGADEQYRYLFCNDAERVEGSSYCMQHTRLSLMRAGGQ